jgi:DNA-binding SARP family transcriptional activator
MSPPNLLIVRHEHQSRNEEQGAMIDADEFVTNTLRCEIERGLACVIQSHFADAATHFALAREQCPATQTPLITAIDAFVECHARYWDMQQLLHEASHRFALVHTEQQERLADIQALVASANGGIASATAHQCASEPLLVPAEARLSPSSGIESPLPALQIFCFGRFSVRRAGEPLALCHNRNGQAIFRYLAAHPRHYETMDVLMDALWPDDRPDVARHKLHVASSALRRTLNGDYACPKGGGYLLCEHGTYQLNPAITIQIDVEEFLTHYRAGQHAEERAQIGHYEAACRLYAGPFLLDDLYADWSQIRREQLTQNYLMMCRALAASAFANRRYDQVVRWATTILEENRCDEAAYRQLMSAYAAQGNRTEALRMYQRCEHMLAEELGVPPLPETTALFYAILHGEPALEASV